ncbi:MAG: serine hydrolase [Gemmatimonadota bacterium]
MRRLFLPVALLTLLAPRSGQAQARPDPQARAKPDPAAQLDRYIQQVQADWGVVGLAIAVVKDGKVVFSKGYGIRTKGTSDPVDPNTLFAIGSTTKAMTAAALGLLVDEKKLKWDDKVTDHLPGFQLIDPWVTRELTVRDLLSHRAGLGNADVLWYGTDLTAAEIVHRARFIPMAYSMRAGYTYQNIMYAVAGEVVAAVSGMPWQTFIQSRILAPLKMTSTVTTLAQTAGRPNVASPHALVADTVAVIENASVDGVASAGSIWSSVTDMARWAAVMIDSGRVDGGRFLAPATWAELFKPQTIIPTSQFYPTARLTRPHWPSYGLGWFQQDYAGRAVEMHTGSIDGMVAIIGLIPEERLGVYVLANMGSGRMELRHALMWKAFDLWLGTGSRDWSKEFLELYRPGWEAQRNAVAQAEQRRVRDTRPTLVLDGYTGVYADSLQGTARIALKDGKLWYQQSEWLTGEMEHWQYDTFRIRWVKPWMGTALVTFPVAETGMVTRMESGTGPDRVVMQLKSRR